MSHFTISEIVALVQIGIGSIIAVAGLGIAVFGMDNKSHPIPRWGVIGLVCWGAWLAVVPLTGRSHDSLPAIAMSALVAYVLVRHGRHVVAILDGAMWWPPNAKLIRRVCWTVHLPPKRQQVQAIKKINPIWLLFANEDDGWFGETSDWGRGRPNSLVTAVLWWLRNPAHNLTWYGLGIADRDRVITGPFAPSTHRPGGGWLTCWSGCVVFERFWLALPFVSYLSPYAKAYIGWRPSGAFGVKLNLSVFGRIKV